MKKLYIKASLILIAVVFLIGCGSGGIGGAPGSCGSEDTNIIIQNVSIVGNPTATDLTPDIDVALHFCDEEQTELEKGLFRVTATMTIPTKLVNPDFDTVFPATVVECTITYYQHDDNRDAPTIASHTTGLSSCILNEGTNECNVLLITIPRKEKFWREVDTGIYTPDQPARYTAFYECKYINSHGEEGCFEQGYEIFLADFDTC